MNEFVLTPEGVETASLQMQLPEDVRKTFVNGFNYRLAEANEQEKGTPHSKNIYSFMASGLYSVSRNNLDGQSGRSVHYAFDKFLKALLPGEEYAGFIRTVLDFWNHHYQSLEKYIK